MNNFNKINKKEDYSWQENQNEISTRWIRETRDDFRAFLDETDFTDPERFRERGPVFKYPEWFGYVNCYLVG